MDNTKSETIINKEHCMKKLVFCAVLAGLTFAPVFAQKAEQVRIKNSTGYSIYYLRISETSSDSWGNDLLGSATISNGSTFTARLPVPLSVANRFDIQVEDEDGDKYYKWNFQVSANMEIEFTMADLNRSRNASPALDPNLPTITIKNNTGYEIWYVKISQTASDTWGPDRLREDQVLPNGSSIMLNLPYALNVTNRYDFRLTDSDGDHYEKRDVRVSANMTLEFTMSDYRSGN
ncbi:MAG: hypothetical protein LBC88_01190 [Spirochaetaceae bacterium]|nr:hypothetical protein [Spirochaetaceae bacterium]